MANQNGLSERPVFNRVVTAVPHLMEVGSLEFRFARGGSFRASVIREQLSSVLRAVDAEKEEFNRALSEMVSYANGLVFGTEAELIERPELVGPVRRNIPEEDLPNLKMEIESRINFLRRTVDFSEIEARAKLRRHTLALTIDNLTWSISRGETTSSDNDRSSFEAAGITITLFRPTGAKSNDTDSFFAELLNPPAETFSFVADKRDIDELVDKLLKIKSEMRSPKK